MLARLLIAATWLGLLAGKPAGPAGQDSLKTMAECQNEENDVYFLLDTSSSLKPWDFEKVRNFVVSFVEKLDIAPHLTRVGVGTFSDNFSRKFDLGHHSNKDDLVKAIKEVPDSRGGTYTGRGLRGMRMSGFRQGVVRENATKIGVVITDGRSRFRTNTITEAALLSDMGVWLFAVGVGTGVDREELSTFASEPHHEFLWHVPTFDDLTRVTNDLAYGACRLQPPYADNATCGLRQRADVIFVYNAAAMSATNVTHVQSFAESVIKEFSMTSGNVRVGVISEGRQGGDIPLSRYIRKEDFVNALRRQPKSDMAAVLRRTREQGFDPSFGGRLRSKKLAIIFVDDVNISIDAMVEARLMTFNDVTVYVIGLGLTGNKGKVRMMASSPSKFMEFESSADLRNRPEREKFVNMLCETL